MKIAVYCRVSTIDQNPEMQKQQIIEYCKNRGLTIYNIYEDKISGMKDSRPQFDMMLYDMRHRRFDAIAVYKLDRIGRSLQHLLQLFQEFKNRDISFISTTQNIDTTTPEGELMLRILMILAEYERQLIVVRTKNTLNNYKEQIDEKGYFVSRKGKRVKKLGRPKGAKDKEKRTRSGYYQRWAEEKHKKTTPRVLIEN